MSSTTMMICLMVAGVATVPSALLGLVTLPLLAVLLIFPLSILIFRKQHQQQPSSTDEAANVILTGGSSGIGLALAKEFVLREDVKHVTLVARSMDKLQAARNEIGSSKIQILSADVTNYESIQAAISQTPMQHKTYLLTCAGASHPGYFNELEPRIFQDQMNLNYLGTVYTVKACLPRIVSGCITLVSSSAGQIGIFGLTAYSPTKFALRGLAESLHMELSTTTSPIHIQLALPNDTDTPGYAQEQQHKPIECHLISQQGGNLADPQMVAKKMVREAMRPNPKFVVSFELEGWMLSALTAGMSPEPSLVAALTQVLLMGWFRLISFFYLQDFYNTIRQQSKQKKTKKQSTNTPQQQEDDEKKNH